MSYQALFYPKSIAVIGASREVNTVGNDVVKNLVTQGFTGEIYPVNPKAELLYGKKVYSSTNLIPNDIDLAIVAVPAPFVTQVVKDARQKNVKAVIVISSGFKEVGNAALETELAQFCQENKITLVGPNCLGVINPKIKMNASFANLMPQAGNIAFISQSGALCTAVLDYAQDLGIGFSKFMSIGNKADLNELKLIKYFAEDAQTKVMAFYVEQLEDAVTLIETVKKVTQGKNAKPIIVLKSGRTLAGSTAIVSHTGSLSGDDAQYDALFKQAGIIRANSISQLFSYAQFFSSHSQLTPVKNVTLITNAGGPGVLATDELINNDLLLTKLESTTQQQLQQILPSAANTHNPIDILGDAMADRYQQSLELAIKDKNTDALVVILTPQSMTEVDQTARAIVATQAKTTKPIIACFMGQKSVESGLKIMRAGGVIVTAFPEPAAQALAAYSKFTNWSQQKSSPIFKFNDVDKKIVADIFSQAKKRNQTIFPEAEALNILQAYGFPVLKNARAKSAAEAAQLVKGMGGKCAMKIVSADILHKSDVGGVALNIDADHAAVEYEQMMKRIKENMPQAKLDGVLLMEMAPQDGVEVILGVNKTAQLGSLIMFGLGGIYVEIFKDTSFAFAPISESDGLKMINSLKSKALFEGARGKKAINKKLLAEYLGRLSQLVTDFPEIIELDINPLLVLPGDQGVKMLDARIITS